MGGGYHTYIHIHMILQGRRGPKSAEQQRAKFAKTRKAIVSDHQHQGSQVTVHPSDTKTRHYDSLTSKCFQYGKIAQVMQGTLTMIY